MDIFKLFGTIAIDNSEAKKALKDTGGEGEKTESKLSNAFRKIGQSVVDNFKKQPIDNTNNSLKNLTSTVNSQEAKLATLKEKYADLYITHGKNSKEAKECANEIKQLSTELNDNKSKLTDAESAADKFDKSIKDAGDSADKSQSKLSKFFSAVGKGAAVVGKAVATGLAAGAAAMGALTMKALNLSGELEQNMGGSEQVFKEYAGKMQDTAKEAFSNMGLSMSDFLATANKMGALFQGAGFSIKESSDLSANAMQRAADVASIMGIDTKDAMEAIAGAAKGNFTMMDNLGVAMNDTTIQAYALSKGIDKSTADMTNQEKIGLAMEMFMEKTAYAAGNYAKENETLAGSLGTAKAALTNFLDGSGNVEGLVSSFKNVATVVVKNLSEIAPRLVQGVTEIVNEIVPLLPPLIQQLLPVIVNGAVSLINGLVAALPMLLDVLTGSALVDLINGFTQIVNSLVSALPKLIQSLVSALPKIIPILINALVSVFVTLASNFSAVIQPIIDYLPDILMSIISALMTNLPILLQGAWNLISALVSAIPQLLGSLFEPLVSWLSTYVIQPVVNFFTGLWESLKGIWDKVVNVIKVAFKFIVSIIKGAFDLITLPWRFIWENCKEYIVKAWDFIKDAISKPLIAIKNAIVNAWTFVSSKTKEVFENVKQFISAAWEKIKAAISIPVNYIKGLISKAWNAIRDTTSNVFGKIKDVTSRVWEAVKSAIEKPINKAKEIVQKGLDAIKGFFDKLKIKFPDIKLPHFSIKGEFKLDPPSVPSLGVDWYAKAMNAPMILDKPTVFGFDAATGRAKGAGEAGSEVVSGTNTLLTMIRGVVADENGAVVYYLQKIVEILATYFPEILEALDFDVTLDGDMIVGGIAPKVDRELAKRAKQKERGKA